MVGYNLTGLAQNTTGIASFMQGVNTGLMGGWFGILFLIGVFAIVFGSFMFTTRGDISRSMTATMFICFIAAIFLRALSLVPDLAIYITLIGAAISLAFAWKTT